MESDLGSQQVTGDDQALNLARAFVKVGPLRSRLAFFVGFSSPVGGQAYDVTRQKTRQNA